MASQPESKIPGPGGGGGGRAGETKPRRSFLPAPAKRAAAPSGIPSPPSSLTSVVVTTTTTSGNNEPPVPPPSKRFAKEETTQHHHHQEEGRGDDSSSSSSAAAVTTDGITRDDVVIPGAENLTVGGRILISGVKPGILRFVGCTHIAQGNWCGIELFDASGLHDGEIDGKRYFTCKPFRGIFAPLDKVFPDPAFPGFVVEEGVLVAEKTGSEKTSSQSSLEQEHHQEQERLQQKHYHQPGEKATKKGEEAEAEEEEKGNKNTNTDNHETRKIPVPAAAAATAAKSGIARLSGIPRVGGVGGAGGIVGVGSHVVKSKSAEGLKENASRIATLSRKPARVGGGGGSSSATAGLNSTFLLDGPGGSGGGGLIEDGEEDAETYSRAAAEKVWRSDSRRYMNITFSSKDSPPPPPLHPLPSSASNPEIAAGGGARGGGGPQRANHPATASTTATSGSCNLPDVVSSASPSPPRETPTRGGTFLPAATSTTVRGGVAAQNLTGESSFGLMDPDLIADETNFLEGVGLLRDGEKATSESDVSQSGASTSTLEDGGSGATLDASTTPQDLKTFLGGRGGGGGGGEEGVMLSGAGVKQNLSHTFAAVAREEAEEAEAAAALRRKDNNGNGGGGGGGGNNTTTAVSATTTASTTATSGPIRAEHLQEEGSTGVSPEVSQVLEWDYDHDAFDGKLLLEKCGDGMSTSNSDSCSSSQTEGGVGVGGGVGGGGVGGKGVMMMMTTTMMAAANASGGGGVGGNGVVHARDVDGEIVQFEEAEDAFENIDEFPLGMNKDNPPQPSSQVMTDSGISENLFLEPSGAVPAVVEEPIVASSSSSTTCSSASFKRRSVEFNSEVSRISPEKEEEVEEGGGGGMTVDANLRKDLLDGHKRLERPLSLVSTTSADTGYAPDTDSEAGGTLTANSPIDAAGYAEKQLNADSKQRIPSSLKSRQSLIGRGLPDEAVKEVEADSDICGDAGLAAVDTEGGPTAADIHDQDESEESEEEEEDDEDEEESSEEETSSEEEESESEEDEDDDDDEDEADDRPEDDRIEADRMAPSGVAAAAARSANCAVRSASEGNSLVVVSATSGGEMSGSAVLGNEMTESAGPGSDATGSGSKDSTAQVAGTSSSTADQSTAANGNPNVGGGKVKKSGQKKKKSSSTADAAENKKTAAERMKAVKTVSSKLADYIKAPAVPSKSKEERAAERAAARAARAEKKNNLIKIKREKKKDKGAATHDALADKSKGDISISSGEGRRDSKLSPVKEEKPKVKRERPKSKWGNIMANIETNMTTEKPKPKSEIKSSLAIYLSTPAAPNPNLTSPPGVGKDNINNGINNKPKKELTKPKSKLVKHPKPDFSNIKSKLNISAPPPKPKPSDTPNNVHPGNPTPTDLNGGSNPRGPGGALRSGSTTTTTTLPRKQSAGRLRMTGHQDSVENASTGASQGTGSCTDLSVTDGAEGKRNAVSCARPRPKHGDRAASVASSKSDLSSAPRAVKSMNLRNAQKSESQIISSRKSSLQSSIPPPTSRRASNAAAAAAAAAAAKPPVKKGVVAPSPGTSVRSRSSPPKVSLPKSGPSTNTRGSVSAAAVASNSTARSKLGGLKSGQPPDVVSTSARGSRAQEVARLESLCEARTKELNYSKMQLREGLQAFDAVTCLLNYCTNQLDAFSCPMVTAQLAAAEGKLAEQLQSIECLQQQKTQGEKDLHDVTTVRDSSLAQVVLLKEEMTALTTVHSAAHTQMREDHATALVKREAELAAQYQNNVQQLQKQHEKQTDYSHQSHRRQVSEVTAEHQMATNQLRVAHLEEIQELRNKHDLQMEELHAQHRNKLEDITHRFESIKLSLSEKVQTLCVECDDLRVRARTSEDALSRDADVKVQLALAPYLNLPKEIESLRMVIDMRTEEIQKLRRQNMDLVKQMEELPIAQEKCVSLQQKVENLQAIINIKTDHEKQLHEKCQVLMRKYDRESRANKRLSMDYEQVMWRMSQSADLGSLESLTGAPRHMSHSPGRAGSSEQHGHGHSSPSPVRRSLSSSYGGGGESSSSNGVTRRQRKISGGDREDDSDMRIRCRSDTFSLDKVKVQQLRNNNGGDSDSSVNGSGGSGSGSGSRCGSPSKKQSTTSTMAKSADYADLIVAAMTEAQRARHDESFSSGGHESPGDPSENLSSMESSVILENSRGVSFNINVGEPENNGVLGGVERQVSNISSNGSGGHDEVFVEDRMKNLPPSASASSPSVDSTRSQDPVGARTDVTVVVNSPTLD